MGDNTKDFHSMALAEMEAQLGDVLAVAKKSEAREKQQEQQPQPQEDAMEVDQADNSNNSPKLSSTELEQMIEKAREVPKDLLPAASEGKESHAESSGGKKNGGATSDSSSSVGSSGRNNGVGGTAGEEGATGGKKDKPKKKPKKQKESLIYGCDGCGKQPLKDCRFNCPICKDFDLCMDCYTAVKPKHVTQHMYAMVRIDIKNPLEVSGKVVEVAEPVEKDGNGNAGAGSSSTSSSSLSSTTPRMVNPSASGKVPYFARREELGSDRSKRRVNSSAGVAGMSMEVLNETIVKAGFSPVASGILSTKRAESFNKLFQVGWDKFQQKSPGNNMSISSRYGQVIMINAITFAKIGYPKKVTDYDLKPNVTVELVKAVLNSILVQLTTLDEEKWFSSPVPKEEPGYYDEIKQPMDLSKIKSKLKNDEYDMKTPEKLFVGFVKDVYLIWKNAMTFNPSTHAVHIAAADNAKTCSMVFQRAIASLELEVESRMLKFTLPPRAGMDIVGQLGRTGSTGSTKSNGNHSTNASINNASTASSSNDFSKRKRSKSDSEYSSSDDEHGALFKKDPKRPFSKGSFKYISPEERKLQDQINRLNSQLDKAYERIDRLIGIVQKGLGSMNKSLQALKQ